MNRQDIIDHARSMLGVKHRHQGRKPWAVDCLGLVVLSLRAAGRDVTDQKGYGRDPQRDRLQARCRAEFGPAGEWVHGGVAVIRWAGAVLPSHVGLLANDRGRWELIHSEGHIGKVVECDIDDSWRARIVEVYDPCQRA